MTNQDENVQSDPLKTYGEGGPQFGLENKTGQKEGFRGWINKYGSSVALPIVALAILSGGIYLYTNQKSEQANLFSKDDLADIQEQQPGNSEQNIMPDSDQETSQPADQVIENIIPQGRKQDNTIIEKAILGDGITNLARRALKDYLKDNSQELTNEHKIYIEDYLKDEIGSQPLEIDQEISFSEDLIKQAIDASLELTPEQLKNLEQYSVLVSW